MKENVNCGSIRLLCTHPVKIAPQLSASMSTPKQMRQTTSDALLTGLDRKSESVFNLGRGLEGIHTPQGGQKYFEGFNQKLFLRRDQDI